MQPQQPNTRQPTFTSLLGDHNTLQFITTPTHHTRNSRYGLRAVIVGEASHPGPANPNANTNTNGAAPNANPNADTNQPRQKRQRRAIALPERTYTTMQPKRLSTNTVTCPTCQADFVAREWRVRNTSNHGDSWHPRCFATAFPAIHIQTHQDTPQCIHQAIHNAAQPPAHQQPQQPPAQPPDPHFTNTPTDQTTDTPLPPLTDLTEVPWDDILTHTHTAKTIPKQCIAIYTQLLLRICQHIIHHTNTTHDASEASNGWKLLLATPRMVLSNTHKHRAGKRNQGTHSHAATIRNRIQLIYRAQFDQLLYPDNTPQPKQKPTQTRPPSTNH